MDGIKFYVAAKWEDREIVKRLQNELINHGNTITVDWTTHFYSGITNNEFRETQRRKWGIEDIDGVKTCDWFVGLFINNEYYYKGALVEWGVALSCNKPCAIIGHAVDTCIFISHPLNYRFNNCDEFLTSLYHGFLTRGLERGI